MEPLAHDDFPLDSENEESVEEEQFVLDPMDVYIFAIDTMAASNIDFQEQISLSLHANEKLDEHIFFFLPDKNFALKNEGCSCISANFQDMVMFPIIEDPIANLLQPSREMNLIVFMDHVHMFSAHLE